MIQLQPTQIDWNRVRRFLVFLVFACVLIIGFFTVFHSLIEPVCISLFFAYILSPLVHRLERLGLGRAMASASIILSLLGIIGFTFASLAPMLYGQFMDLIQHGPAAFHTWYATLLPQVHDALARFGLTEQELVEGAMRKFNIASQLLERFESGLGGIWDTSSRLLGGVVNLVLVPLLTFFMLREEDSIAANLSRLIPVDLLVPTKHVAATFDATLRSVLKGQVIVAAIDGLMYMVGFSVLGVQSGIAIGFAAGICRFIPYLDAIVGLLLALISVMSHFSGWGQVVGVLVVVLVVQTLDGVFVTPRVIGEKVGLHPIIVILSVFAFGKVFGFWGVLIAIPVAAIFKSIGLSGLPFYYASAAFTGQGTFEGGTLDRGLRRHALEKAGRQRLSRLKGPRSGR